MRAIVCSGLMALVITTAGAAEFKPAPISVCIDQESAATLKRLINRGVRLSSIDNKQIGNQVRALCTERFPEGAQHFDQDYAQTVVLEKLNVLMRADFEKQMAETRKREEERVARDAPKLKEEDAAASQAYGACLLESARTLVVPVIENDGEF